jgi:hypothetical protein
VLKITISEAPTEERWILQGRLVGPWVDELRTSWEKTRSTGGRRTCIVDLNDVSFIDKGGEKLLRSMSKQGAKLVADGMYIKHVLEQLKTNGMRGLTSLIVCLFAVLQTNVIVPPPSGRVRTARLETRVKEDSRLRLSLASSSGWSTESSFDASSVAELMNAIDGANATRSSADRVARKEDQ